MPDDYDDEIADADDIEDAFNGVPPNKSNFRHDQRIYSKKQNTEVSLLNIAVSELNEEHAVVMSGGDCVVMSEVIDPTNGFLDITLSSFANFRNKYLNQKLANPWRSKSQGKYKDLGSLWLEHTDRREYEKIIFDPALPPEPERGKKRFCNLFKGFPIEPKQGSWYELQEHLFRVICDSDVEVFEWVMKWQRAIFQSPGWKNPTAITMISGQGTGKGTWADYLGALVGKHYRIVQKGQSLVGKFNYKLKDSIIVFADEVTWGGNKDAEGVLKTIITQPTIDVEAKFKDSFEVKNCINLIIASNNEWVIPAGLDDRRFCVLRTAEIEGLKNNPEYFKQIRNEMDNGGLSAMMYDMLNPVLTEQDYLDLRIIPRTKELFKQILLTMHPVHKYWYECLLRGRLLEHDDEWKRYVPKAPFYQVFCDSRYSGQYVPAPNQFKGLIQDMLPQGCPVRMYKPTIGTDRIDCYKFPDLDVCRKAFTDKIKISVDWEKEGVTLSDRIV